MCVLLPTFTNFVVLVLMAQSEDIHLFILIAPFELLSDDKIPVGSNNRELGKKLVAPDHPWRRSHFDIGSAKLRHTSNWRSVNTSREI